MSSDRLPQTTQFSLNILKDIEKEIRAEAFLSLSFVTASLLLGLRLGGDRSSSTEGRSRG